MNIWADSPLNPAKHVMILGSFFESDGFPCKFLEFHLALLAAAVLIRNASSESGYLSQIVNQALFSVVLLTVFLFNFFICLLVSPSAGCFLTDPLWSVWCAVLRGKRMKPEGDIGQ